MKITIDWLNQSNPFYSDTHTKKKALCHFTASSI